MNTRNCNDGIFDWFPMVQRFTRSFLDRLFAYKDVKDKKKILDPFMGSSTSSESMDEADTSGDGSGKTNTIVSTKYVIIHGFGYGNNRKTFPREPFGEA